MKRFLFIMALFLGLSTAVTALPSDIVPLQNWSYDFLMHLAAKGALPGHTAREFTGEKLYTHEEIAEFAALPIDSGQLSAVEVGLLNSLRTDFRPYSKTLEAPVTLEVPTAGSQDRLLPTGFLRGRTTWNSDSDSDSNLVTDKIYRGTVLAPLTANGVMVIGFTDQPKETSLKPDAFPALSKAYVQFNPSRWHIEIGRDALRWGPGYSGAMLMSDNAPSFTSLNLSYDLNAGRLGEFKLTQMATTFRESGERHYLATRRLEKQVNSRFGFSLMEAFNATKVPDAGLLVLPFYLYQRIIHDNDRFFNYLAGANIWVRPTPRTEAYIDYIVDDITGPFNWNDGYAPRKIGYLAGGRIKDVFGNGRTDLRLEYAFTDATSQGGTYWFRTPTDSWYHEGLPIGHPLGTGGKGIYARVDHKLSKRMTAIGTFSMTERRQTDPPQIDPPATIPVQRVTRGDLYLAYDLDPAKSLSLRVTPFRVKNAGNVQGLSDNGTQVEFAATLAF